MKISEFMAGQRATAGETALGTELVLSRHREAAARDETTVAPLEEQIEDHAVMMLSAGYVPGALQALALKAGGKAAEIEDERAKIAKARRRGELVTRMIAAGQAGGLDVPGMLDGDLGDPARVERLERELEGLRRMLAAETEAAAGVVRRARADSEEPAQRVERVRRTAHQEFRESTRRMLADEDAGRPWRGPLPSVSRAAVVSAESCADCERVGASPSESVKIHEGLDADGRVISR